MYRLALSSSGYSFKISIWVALVKQELPETTAKLCGFPQELLVSVSAPEEVVHLFSDLLQPDYEVAKGSLAEERAKQTLVREEVDLASDTVHSVPWEVVSS